jgi:hypothetical protein
MLALFLAGSIAAKAIGSLQPPSPAMRGFIEGCEDKPQPCWYNIVPGISTVEQANKIINGLDYIGCEIHLISITQVQTIEAIEFKRCESIQWGDLILQFGITQPRTINAPVYLDLSSKWPLWKVYDVRISKVN